MRQLIEELMTVALPAGFMQGAMPTAAAAGRSSSPPPPAGHQAPGPLIGSYLLGWLSAVGPIGGAATPLALARQIMKAGARAKE